MSAYWTNPDAKLHVGQLKSQARVFSLVWDRMVKDDRFNEATQLHNELVYLNTIIAAMEGAKR